MRSYFLQRYLVLSVSKCGRINIKRTFRDILSWSWKSVVIDICTPCEEKREQCEHNHTDVTSRRILLNIGPLQQVHTYTQIQAERSEVFDKWKYCVSYFRPPCITVPEILFNIQKLPYFKILFFLVCGESFWRVTIGHGLSHMFSRRIYALVVHFLLRKTALLSVPVIEDAYFLEPLRKLFFLVESPDNHFSPGAHQTRIPAQVQSL